MTHREISFTKSVIRILGYLLIGINMPVLVIPAAVLVLSEILGVLEEIGQ